MLTNAAQWGFDIEIETATARSFFGEGGARILICIPKENFSMALKVAQDYGLRLQLVATIKSSGRTHEISSCSTKLGQLKAYFGTIDLADCMRSYREFFSEVVKP